MAGGACVAGGVHGRGHEWGGMHGRGCAWQIACVAGRCTWQEVCMAGDTTTAANGTHPT